MSFYSRIAAVCYATRMTMESHDSAKEGSWYDDSLRLLWPDVVTALETHPAGFKKQHLEEEARRAFDRAAQQSEDTFGTPEYMIEVLSSDEPLPEGMDRQHLLHFAGRWKGRIETAKRVAQGKGEARGEAGMVILHGNRNSKQLTREEEKRRQEDKRRNKKKRP